MERKIVWVLLFGLMLHCCVAFPRSDSPSSESNSSEDDKQQQQQQNIDAESLGDFTKKIKTKGRANPNEKLKEDLDDPCHDPKRVGICKAAVPRFYFNKAEGKCEFFVFGGCGANRNNFKGLSDCETTCEKHLKKEVIIAKSILPIEDENESFCGLPALQNPRGVQCMGYMPRWTYNSAEQKCESFIYGGCGGTKNIFGSQEQCESTCGGYKKPEKSETPSDPTPTPISTVIPIVSQDACSLPMDKGLCYAIKYKYFFNKEDNRCEKFEYGGCGGNANRFTTADECIRTCGGDAPAHNPECATVNCPWALYTHYTTLDCKPIYDAEACCPTRFECPDNQQSNNTIDGARSLTLPAEVPQPKCSYKGKTYAIGENVPEASDAGSCRAACLCTEGSSANQGAKITCASIECPENLGGPRRPGCVPLYKRGNCCADDFYCPNNTLTIIDQSPEAEATPENFKCEVDDNGYFEGQRFYPKKSPCLKCICQKGFNGTLSEEFCENIDCGIEIYYSHYLARGCAPVYFQSEDGGSSCCPISWECPDERTNASVVPMPVPVRPTMPVDTPVGPVPPTKPVGPVPVSIGTESPSMVPNPTMAVLPPKPDQGGKRILVTVEACQLPKEVGECKARRRRYFYNKNSKVCEEFIFSGCRGNDNNFASIQDCQRLCVPVPADSGNRGLLRSLDSNQQEPQPRAIYVTEVDPCTMARKTGNCKGFFQRFYFSPEDNSCQSFIFGGCRGNGNNFYTRESCEATCSNSISGENLRTNVPTGSSAGDASMVNFGEDVPVPSVNSKSIGIDVDPCSLPKKIGFCKASIRRFHYDSDAKECKEFIYGGCGGNTNNFLSSRDCERRCVVREVGVPRTQLQVQPTEGGDIPSNPSSPQENNGFRELRPSPSGFLERCRLPRKSGSCPGIHPSYYYDADEGTCNFFFYSGCYGNANRFTTLEECESTCKQPPTAEQEGIGGRLSMNRNSWRSGVTGNEDATGTDMIPPTPNRPKPSSSSLRNPKEENDKDLCKLPSDTGRGKAYVLRYYWDSATKQCLPFVWSGMRGNKNNFLTESDCVSACGEQPTIEQLTSEGVLSCSFGNETLPLGATVGGQKYSPDEMPCGVPICQCLTPPSVTCVQIMCPTPPPPPPGLEKVCNVETCDSNCSETVGVDGCPTCDCETDNSQQVQVQEPEEVFVKSVKG